MKPSRYQRESAKAEPESGTSKTETDWEMRPGGMLVQRREESEVRDVPMIRINVSYGTSHHEIFVPAQSTFGELKKSLAPKVVLEPADQRLFFRGKEKEDDENLHMAGIKDNSKILLLEHPASKEKKLEQLRKIDEMSKASEAVAGVRTEVDKLYGRIAALEVAIQSGQKVADKEFEISTELLMRQLLKLDGIEAEGEARAQRKAEVRRVQRFVDMLDSLKARNANPFSDRSNTVSVTTNWEYFESGVGSLSPTRAMPSSTDVNKDWEQF